jgi:hypothetical protein
MAAGPGKAITSDVDVLKVFASPDLVGLYGFKPIAQQRDYTCGAAAVVSVLRYMGMQSNETQASEAMGTNPVVGTRPEDMIRYLRKRELCARAYTGVPFDALVQRITEGKITLVDWNDWGGHWVVVTGWSAKYDAIVLADPAKPRSHFSVHSRKQFIEHWHCPPFEPGAHLRQLALFVDNRKLGRTPTRDYIRIHPYSQVEKAREGFSRRVKEGKLTMEERVERNRIYRKKRRQRRKEGAQVAL